LQSAGGGNHATPTTLARSTYLLQLMKGLKKEAAAIFLKLTSFILK